MATTIIRSTDAAAVSASAILTGNAGSLVAVLDYALVTVLGWTKSFTATNKGVYRAPAGVRHYLDVDDSGPDATALGRNARLRGYEVATAVGTGTGPFPTTGQAATPVVVKSTATGTTARPWLVIGDDRSFYLFSSSNLTDPPTLSTHTWTDGFYFGEIVSAITGDTYRSILCAPSVTSTAATAASAMIALGTPNDSVSNSWWMPRSYLGTGGSEHAGPVPSPFSSTALYAGFTTVTFPNLPDGGIYLNGIDVTGRGTAAGPAAATYIRGRLRGLYSSAHYATAMNDQDTFSGVGDFTGKTFIAIQCAGTKGRIVALETTAWTAST